MSNTFADFPQITYRYPLSANGLVADASTDIIFDWNLNINTIYFSDPVNLQKYVVLFEKDTSTVVETVYTSYDPTLRRVTLNPASPLMTGKTYVVLINRGIQDVLGRSCNQDYRWEFTLADSPVSIVQTISPPDSLICNIFPSLQFLSINVSGTVYYQAQIAQRFDFVNPTYDVTYTYNQPSSGIGIISVTPAGYFPAELTYYWRVRAFTDEATGGWSNTGSFYFGTVRIAHPSSSESWNDPLPFQILGTTFKNGLSNQPSYPNMTINFSSLISSTPNFTVIAKDILPRNDQPDTYIDRIVDGTWNAGPASSFTFTPTDPIQQNTRYEITVPGNTIDVNGNMIGQDVIYYFTGQYNPFYVTPRAIRARFMGSDSNIPDDLINYYIFMASLEAKARYYGVAFFPSMDTFLGDGLKEVYVRDTINLNSYGTLKWTEAAATYLLLQGILRRELFSIGRTRTQGDTTVKVEKAFLDAMQAAKQDAEKELLAYGELLSPNNFPLSVSRGETWSNRAWQFDWQVGSIAIGRETF